MATKRYRLKERCYFDIFDAQDKWEQDYPPGTIVEVEGGKWGLMVYVIVDGKRRETTNYAWVVSDYISKGKMEEIQGDQP